MNTQRRLLLVLSITIALAFGTTVQAAGPKKVTVDQERLAQLPVADQQRVLYIAERLEAMTNMDRSTLTSDERRALRRELRSLKKEANAYDHAAGGTVIYISGIGLILLIILLIVLL